MNIHNCLLSKIKPSNKVFEVIKNDYPNFKEWYQSLPKDTGCYYTKKNNKITSILILKINENDSQQLKEENLLKIRTLNVLDTNKGIGTKYLKLIDEIAKTNNIKTIYVTCKSTKKDFISFLNKNNYKIHKQIKDEIILIKKCYNNNKE